MSCGDIFSPPGEAPDGAVVRWTGSRHAPLRLGLEFRSFEFQERGLEPGGSESDWLHDVVLTYLVEPPRRLEHHRADVP